MQARFIRYFSYIRQLHEQTWYEISAADLSYYGAEGSGGRIESMETYIGWTATTQHMHSNCRNYDQIPEH